MLEHGTPTTADRLIISPYACDNYPCSHRTSHCASSGAPRSFCSAHGLFRGRLHPDSQPLWRGQGGYYCCPLPMNLLRTQAAPSQPFRDGRRFQQEVNCGRVLKRRGPLIPVSGLLLFQPDSTLMSYCRTLCTDPEDVLISHCCTGGKVRVCANLKIW